MAIIRKKDMRGMNDKGLEERLKDLKLELLKINAQKSAQRKNVKIKETRKTIARILTMLNQKRFEKENKKQEKEKR